MVEVLQVIATNKLKEASRVNASHRGPQAADASIDGRNHGTISDNMSIAGTRGAILGKPVSQAQDGIRKLEATLARVAARRDQLSDPYYLHQLKSEIKTEQKHADELLKAKSEIESANRAIAADLARLLRAKAKTAQRDNQGGGAAEMLDHN